MFNLRKNLITLLLLLFAVGCMPAAPESTDEEPQTADVSSTPELLPPTVTSTPLSTVTVVPATKPSLTPTVTSSARIAAVNGNLFIRRGPGTEYNRIGILKSGETADVIGQDMLSKWVQVRIPGMDVTGWVSLMTPFSRVDGDLNEVDAFTFTEWPEPAYIKNCTEHDIIIMPNELYLYSLWTNAQYLNQSQIDPGYYEVRDASLPDEPLIQKVDIKEGDFIYITMNGLDEYHNCPENN